jgi:hypothetical protein
VNPVRQLQEDSLALLLGNPATAMVPFTSFRKQVVEAVQAESIGAWKIRAVGKIGLACLVLMPRARSQYPNVPGPQLKIELTIRTLEDPKVNNTGMTCEDVALENLRWLDGMLIGGVTQLYANHDEDALQPVMDYPGFLAYDSILYGEMPQDYGGRTPTPTVADNGDGTVLLGCSDPAAKIYYTTDGSMPQPGLQEHLYIGGPIGTPIGTTLSYLAWNPELLPSDVPRAISEVNPPTGGGNPLPG